MRTTVDLPDDPYRPARSIARHRSPHLERTVAELMRRGLAGGQPGSTTQRVAAAPSERPRHGCWSDGIRSTEVPLGGIVGHRQVTDAYLVRLAGAHAARLVSFDGGLAAIHRDAAGLVPTG